MKPPDGNGLVIGVSGPARGPETIVLSLRFDGEATG
jgi:hypothetical protein